MYIDEKSGICYTLGENGDVNGVIDEKTGDVRYYMNFDGRWPTLAGIPLSMNLVDDTEDCAMFNVDVRINDYPYLDYLRVVQNYDKNVTDENGKTVEKPEYELNGFWDGYDEHTGLPGRNSYSLNEYKGEKMTLFRLAYSNELKKVSAHADVKEMIVTEDMKVTKEPLPKGEYLYRFVVRDVFGNRIDSGELKPVSWDGKNVSFPVKENK